MNCTEVQKELSAFYDEELTVESHAQVHGHVARCPTCAKVLGSFVGLTRLCRQLPNLVPDARLWSRIEASLQHGPTLVGRWRRCGRFALVVAAVVAATVVSFVLRSGHLVSHDAADRYVTNEFGDFLDEFSRDPNVAQRALLRNFDGKRIESTDAISLVGYQPSALRAPPKGYSRQAAYVLKMPCCVCTETIYRRIDGQLLAIFEHEDKQPSWFGGRPQIEIKCNDKPTRIVQLQSQLAVTWKQQWRYITVVGARDVAEVSQLMEHLRGADSLSS